MEHALISIKQEPEDMCAYDGNMFPSVDHQEIVGKNEHGEEAGNEFASQWQAVNGVLSVKNTLRPKQPIRGQPYVCSECEYRASRADVLKHQRLHTKARPYVCLLCNFAGTQNSHLRSHFKRHHARPLDDDNHMIIPQSHFICQKCHVIFPTQEKLQTHLHETHGSEEQTPSNHEEEKTKDMHEDHLQRVQAGHQNGGLDESVTRTLYSSSEDTTDTQSTFTDSNAFKHRENKNRGIFAVKNPGDDNSAPQQYVVVCGNNGSSEVKSFPYEDLSAASADVLATPIGIKKKKTKTFTCSECGYKGGRKDVQKHLTVHTGFHPYVCLQCSHTTAQNSHMRTHFKKVHPEEEVEFDVRRHEFYICSSCLYFFLSQESFNKHFDGGRCALLGSTTCSDMVSPDQLMLPNHMPNNSLNTTNEGTKDWENERDIQSCDTGYDSSNVTTLEEARNRTQRTRQRKNADPKCTNTNGTCTFNTSQSTQSDVLNRFNSKVKNDSYEISSDKVISWSVEPTTTTVTSPKTVDQQTHVSVPPLAETLIESSKKPMRNQEKMASHSQDLTSRLLQNSTISASFQTLSSHQNGGKTLTEENLTERTSKCVEEITSNNSCMDRTGAIVLQTVGNGVRVPQCSLSDSSSVIVEQDCDKDVHTVCSATEKCQSSVPRNIRKAAQSSLQKYTQAQKRQKKTSYKAMYRNSSKPIKPFVWHFQGRSYITYEIAGKTSRSLPKGGRQMACNFCPYKTSNKELLHLHMRRHLWMA